VDMLFGRCCSSSGTCGPGKKLATRLRFLNYYQDIIFCFLTLELIIMTNENAVVVVGVCYRCIYLFLY